ncbi:hypothetical protein TeGR_g13201 [Tetraparma gracilis]|uniref:Uncharacterized protein n=1 Tax=Tetraparma gracilis TaxID=2962635 RepID=A0ABQ6MP41_9STRA|nr:hypothetical protein TeGR_g13201 [Tetraparma gracilis]
MTSTTVTNPVNAKAVEVTEREAAASPEGVAIDIGGADYPFAVPLPPFPVGWEGVEKNLKETDCVGVLLIPVVLVLVVAAWAAWLPVAGARAVMGGRYLSLFFVVFPVCVAWAILTELPLSIILTAMGMYSLPYKLTSVGTMSFLGGNNTFTSLVFEWFPWTSGRNDKLIQLARANNTKYVLTETGMEDNETDDERNPSFAEFEASISSAATLDAKCDAVLNLVDGKLHKLRIIDMMCCKHEGDDDELWRRLVLSYDKFLGPMTVRCSREPPIPKKHAELVRYVGGAFVTVRDLMGTTERLDKWTEETLAPTVNKATAELESLYGKEYTRLQGGRAAKDLFALPKKKSYLEPAELTHGRFMKGPRFAYSRDLVDVANELQGVSVVDSPAALCELLSLGHHPLINGGKGTGVFEKNTKDKFWWALVMLWQIGVHKRVEKEFGEAMQGLARGKVECRVAPIKGFERAMEKAEEYAAEKKLEKDSAERILAPMHVVDMLRCSFTVDTVEENLAIGRALESKFAVVRTKNNHQPGHLGYADRNYNLLFEGKDGSTKVVCEVQILMRRYIEIKKIGHLLYELVR